MNANDSPNGWTTRMEGSALRRSDKAPEQFQAETVKANPSASAWDEPGYIDPDLSHGSLELGTRYWQGFAKRATPPHDERAMSPEWVAKITAPNEEAEEAREEFREFGDGLDIPTTAPEEDEVDPLRPRVVRETENQRHSILPG